MLFFSHLKTYTQLRDFVSLMLKHSMGGFKSKKKRLSYWPPNLNWKHPGIFCASDMRRIVRACYHYHGREDLIPEKDSKFFLYQWRLQLLEARQDVALKHLPTDFQPIILPEIVAQRLGPELVAAFEESTARMWRKMKPSLLEASKSTGNLRKEMK